jgi:hypothetical protein
LTLALAATGSPALAKPPGAQAASPDPAAVLHWNELAVRTDLAAAQTNQEGMLHLAYVQAAVFDAVDAVDGGFRPYVGHLRARGHVDGDAAVAAAAHRVLVTQYPVQTAMLDADYTTALAAIPDGQAKTRGVTVGEQAATDLLQTRTGDGFEADVPYTFGSGPGVWVLPTDNPVTTPATPWMAKMRPFVMRSADQFRPGPPPSLTSAAYARSYQETMQYGSADSTVRTPEQTAIALFWGLSKPDAQYDEAIRGVIDATRMDRVEAAHALALINLVASDAFIACFDGKYAYSAWRPYTAIREGDTDGNPSTVADPNWTPLVKTPNHPEYPANHACVTTSFTLTAADLFGKHFDLTISEAPASTATRTFTSPRQLITEIANARIWGGVHFRYSTNAGTRIGVQVADYDITHAMQQTDHP